MVKAQSLAICKGQAIQKVRKGEYFQVWKTNVPGYEATEGTERRTSLVENTVSLSLSM